jgi:Arc/MetJ-type ribon-helix-helix transcriptional regulator
MSGACGASGAQALCARASHVPRSRFEIRVRVPSRAALALRARGKPADMGGKSFWESLSEAGHRVAIVDVPHTALSKELNGIHVMGWGGCAADQEFGIWPFRGMVVGMATRKVTVTLDESQLARMRALVIQGAASSVSGFVQHAVGVSLDDVAGWGAMLADALRDSGGELSREERSWADNVLGVTNHPGSSAA